jgi:hypothetical protein
MCDVDRHVTYLGCCLKKKKKVYYSKTKIMLENGNCKHLSKHYMTQSSIACTRTHSGIRHIAQSHEEGIEIK